jgi:hypothetical protein
LTDLSKLTLEREEENNMKLFSLEEALAGHPVKTRDGRPVTQLTNFSVTSDYSLIGVIEGEFYKWMRDGGHLSSYVESERDLFMAPVKKTGWVARYKEGGVCGTFATEEQARSICENRTATYHEITWEE